MPTCRIEVIEDQQYAIDLYSPSNSRADTNNSSNRDESSVSNYQLAIKSAMEEVTSETVLCKSIDYRPPTRNKLKYGNEGCKRTGATYQTEELLRSPFDTLRCDDFRSLDDTSSSDVHLKTISEKTETDSTEAPSMPNALILEIDSPIEMSERDRKSTNEIKKIPITKMPINIMPPTKNIPLIKKHNTLPKKQIVNTPVGIPEIPLKVCSPKLKPCSPRNLTKSPVKIKSKCPQRCDQESSDTDDNFACNNKTCKNVQIGSKNFGKDNKTSTDADSDEVSSKKKSKPIKEKSFENMIIKSVFDNIGTIISVEDNQHNALKKLSVQHMPVISIKRELVVQQVLSLDIKTDKKEHALAQSSTNNICYREYSYNNGNYVYDDEPQPVQNHTATTVDNYTEMSKNNIGDEKVDKSTKVTPSFNIKTSKDVGTGNSIRDESKDKLLIKIQEISEKLKCNIEVVKDQDEIISKMATAPKNDDLVELRMIKVMSNENTDKNTRFLKEPQFNSSSESIINVSDITDTQAVEDSEFQKSHPKTKTSAENLIIQRLRSVRGRLLSKQKEGKEYLKEYLQPIDTNFKKSGKPDLLYNKASKSLTPKTASKKGSKTSSNSIKKKYKPRISSIDRHRRNSTSISTDQSEWEQPDTSKVHKDSHKIQPTEIMKPNTDNMRTSYKIMPDNEEEYILVHDVSAQASSESIIKACEPEQNQSDPELFNIYGIPNFVNAADLNAAHKKEANRDIRNIRDKTHTIFETRTDKKNPLPRYIPNVASNTASVESALPEIFRTYIHQTNDSSRRSSLYLPNEGIVKPENVKKAIKRMSTYYNKVNIPKTYNVQVEQVLVDVNADKKEMMNILKPREINSSNSGDDCHNCPLGDNLDCGKYMKTLDRPCLHLQSTRRKLFNNKSPGSSASSAVDASASEGEIKCKCSVSNGELHACTPKGKATSMFVMKKQAVPNVKYRTGSEQLHFSRRHFYNTNFVSYYVPRNSSPGLVSGFSDSL